MVDQFAALLQAVSVLLDKTMHLKRGRERKTVLL